MFVVLFFVVTSNYFDYYVLPILLEPIKLEFGVSDAKLGVLSGVCFALCYAVAALPIARWSDYGNRRTVISLSVAGWSLMTAIGGLTRSFWQLACTRLGMGLMEPGALPPAQSLLSDYFPVNERAAAISFLTMGASAVGSILGIGLGGYVATSYGWRGALLMAGAPGLILAIVVRTTLAEPRCAPFAAEAARSKEGFLETVRHLGRKRSFVWAIVGSSTFLIFAYGLSVFIPSFMIRALNATVVQVSLYWGLTVSVADASGGLLGGLVVDRLSARDIRWYSWMPAIACVAGIPLYGLVLTAHSLGQFLGMEFLAEFATSMGYPIFFVTIQAVCGIRRRTMASAIAQAAGILFGGGLGPLTAGLLSDAFGAAYGLQSLRYALTSMTLLLLPAALAFFRVGRTLRSDLEDSTGY